MRGQILKYDAGSGAGLISGDDGARYRFAAADLTSSGPPAAGAEVDFVIAADGQARDIVVMARAPDAAPVRYGAFDFGRVVQRTFSAIGKNWAVFFGAATVLAGGPSILLAIGQTNLQSSQFESGAAFMAIGMLLYVVGVYLLQAAIIKAAINGFSGKSTSFAAAFDVAIRLFFPLVGLSIISFLGTMLGLILLVVPGIMLMVLWSVSSAALVVEKRGVFGSLQRSRDLTRGYRWPVFGLLVVYCVLTWIATIALSAVGAGLGLAFSGSPLLVINLVSGVAGNILSGVIGAAGVAALYYELRTAKEGAEPDELAAVFD